MKRLPLLALALLCASLHAAPISPAVHDAVMVIADAEGVPRSVANWLQIEESGDRRTGTWGDARAVSREAVRGFHSEGLFQIFAEPRQLEYLLAVYWHDGTFDIFDPVDNATLALRYLHALHRRFGSWYLALCYFNHGDILHIPEETKAYARRICEAHY
jgi:hypothetical protein